MALPVWPPDLPQKPLADGFSREPIREFELKEFTSESGVEHSRPRITGKKEIVSCAFLLTKAELAIFRDFYRNDLVKGSHAYRWQDPVDEVEGTYKIKAMSESHVTGGNFRVSLQIRRLT